MICESGLGERHLMPEGGSVYVYTLLGARLVGELVACRPCAEHLARDPQVVAADWSTDAQGDPVLILVCRKGDSSAAGAGGAPSEKA